MSPGNHVAELLDAPVSRERPHPRASAFATWAISDGLVLRRPNAASASRSPANASRRTRSSARPRWRNTASPPLRSPARAQVEAGSDRQSSPGAIVISGAESSGQNPVGWALTRIEPTFVSSAPRLIDGSVEPVAEMPVPSPPAPAELPAESPGARASAAVVAMAAIVEWRAMCMKWSLRQRGWLPLNTETFGGWITRGVVRAGNRIVRGKPRRSSQPEEAAPECLMPHRSFRRQLDGERSGPSRPTAIARARAASTLESMPAVTHPSSRSRRTPTGSRAATPATPGSTPSQPASSGAERRLERSGSRVGTRIARGVGILQRDAARAGRTG